MKHSIRIRVALSCAAIAALCMFMLPEVAEPSGAHSRTDVAGLLAGPTPPEGAALVRPSRTPAGESSGSAGLRVAAPASLLVLDHADVPVLDAEVHRLESDGSWSELRTDEGGALELRGDETWMHLAASGLLPRLVRLGAEPGAQERVRLAAPAALRVALRTPHGVPIEGARIALLPPAPQGISWRSDAESGLRGFAQLVHEQRNQLPDPNRLLDGEALPIWRDFNPLVWQRLLKAFPEGWMDSDCDPHQLIRSTDHLGVAAFDHIPASDGYTVQVLENFRIELPDSEGTSTSVAGIQLDAGGLNELTLTSAPSAGFYGWIAPNPRPDPASSARLVLRKHGRAKASDGSTGTGWSQVRTIDLDSTRTFLVEGLEPGSYLLSACWGSNIEGQSVATRKFTLHDRELLDLGPLKAKPGAALSGRVEFVDADGQRLDPVDLFEDPASARTELRLSSGADVATADDVTQFFQLPPEHPIIINGAARGTYLWQAQLPLFGPILRDGWELRHSVVRGTFHTDVDTEFVARILVDRVLETRLHLSLPAGAEAQWTRVFAHDIETGSRTTWNLTPDDQAGGFTGTLRLPDGRYELLARAWSENSPIGYTWFGASVEAGLSHLSGDLSEGRTLELDLVNRGGGSLENALASVGVTAWGADSEPIATQRLTSDDRVTIPGLPFDLPLGLRLPPEAQVVTP